MKYFNGEKEVYILFMKHFLIKASNEIFNSEKEKAYTYCSCHGYTIIINL
jgi:hypothetical protein